MLTASKQQCDWCGEISPIKIKIDGEDGCKNCAPYMQAAYAYPQTAQQSRQIADRKAAWRSVQRGS